MFRVVRVASHPIFIPTIVLSFGLLFLTMRISTGQFRQPLYQQRRLDAIFVLSGGHTIDGKAPEWTVRRVEKAYELLMSHGEPFPKIVCVGGGGEATPPMMNKYGLWVPGEATPPMMNKYGLWVPECTLCSEYLHHEKNVDYNLLLREYTSHDTLGNGFFSLLNHALPTRWRQIAIVTSEFHMPRAKFVFEYVYGLPGAGLGHGIHSKQFGSKAQGFQLEYHEASDKGFDEMALENRRIMEVEYIDKLKALSKNATTLQKLHQWVMVEYRQYNTRAQHEIGKIPQNLGCTELENFHCYFLPKD